MKQLTKIFLTAFVLFVIVSVNAQKKDYTKEPGYVDFGDLSSLAADGAGTEINLEGQMLKNAAKSFQKDNPDLAELINGLKVVRVNQFNTKAKNKTKVENKIEALDKELISANWNKVVKTNGKAEIAYVYIKTNGGEKVCGVVVLNYKNNKQAAFVNIIGDIKMEKLSSLTDKFNLPRIKE
jgi:hypothetical protein